LYFALIFIYLIGQWGCFGGIIMLFLIHFLEEKYKINLTRKIIHLMIFTPALINLGCLPLSLSSCACGFLLFINYIAIWEVFSVSEVSISDYFAAIFLSINVSKSDESGKQIFCSILV
jgi:hypothetical protein